MCAHEDADGSREDGPREWDPCDRGDRSGVCSEDGAARSREAIRIEAEGSEVLRPTVMEEIERSENADRVWVRWSIGVAVALHVLLFAVQWPSLVDATEQPRTMRDRPIMVLVNYPPQRKPPVVEVPIRPPARMIPIPSQEPQDPEPIRELAAPVAIDQGLDGTVWGSFEPPSPPPEPERPEVLLVGGDVSRPVRISGVEPRYPEAARAARIEGTVILSCVVDRSGRVGEIEVLRGAALGLTEAAVEAVRTWVYRPGELNGKPVDVRFVVTVRFGLK